MEKTTSFEPKFHGFPFVNFTETIDLGILGGHKNKGFCGGMVWAALDRYYGHKLDNIRQYVERPEKDEALYQELLNRHIAMFMSGLLFRMTNPQELLMMDAEDEWKIMKQRINVGLPSTLVIIYADWEPPTFIPNYWENHIVLAIGYAEESKGNYEIHLYDPNSPDYKPSINVKDGEISYIGKVNNIFYQPYDKQERLIPKTFMISEQAEKLYSDLSWFWSVWG